MDISYHAVNQSIIPSELSYSSLEMNIQTTSGEEPHFFKIIDIWLWKNKCVLKQQIQSAIVENEVLCRTLQSMSLE